MATKKRPLKKGSTSRKTTMPKDSALVNLDDKALERLADGFLLDYEYDENRIASLVGFLEYLVTVAKNPSPSAPFGHVDDIVHVVNQRIFGNVAEVSVNTREQLSRNYAAHSALLTRSRLRQVRFNGAGALSSEGASPPSASLVWPTMTWAVS